LSALALAEEAVDQIKVLLDLPLKEEMVVPLKPQVKLELRP
jgi:hypothetical protein